MKDESFVVVRQLRLLLGALRAVATGSTLSSGAKRALLRALTVPRRSGPQRSLLGRSTPLKLLLTAVAALALTGTAIAAGGPPADPGGGVAPAEQVKDGEAPGFSARGRHSLKQDADREERKAAERKRHLDSGPARAERRRSETAHSGADDREAVELIGRRFSKQLEPVTPEPEELARSGQVRGFLDDYTMRIDVPGRDGDQLVVGTSPLRATDDSGRKAPIDLDLEQRGSTYEPENGPAEVSLPSKLEDGLRVGAVRILPESPAPGRAEAAKVGDDRLVYPNSGADTDFAVIPLSSGVETFSQLRSPQSPELQRLRFALPDGAQLSATDDGGAAVTRQAKTLVRVLPPSAVDAQGTKVPVSYRVAGSTLEVLSPHRERDFAYPILVDPIIEDWSGSYGSQSWYTGHNLQGMSDWRFLSNAPTTEPTRPWAPLTSCYTPISCYGSGRGLHLYGYGNRVVPAGAFGEWLYEHYGTTTQIPGTWFVRKFLRRRSAGQPPFFWTGIWSQGLSDYTGLTSWPTVDLSDHSNYVAAGSHRPNSGRNVLAFGFYSSVTTASPYWRDGYLGGAYIYLDDPEPPTVTGVAVEQDRWVDGAETVSVRAAATDPGLGVKDFNLHMPREDGATSVQTRSHPCSGRKSSRCPSPWSLPDLGSGQGAFSFKPDDVDLSAAGDQRMGEGTKTVRAVPYDPTGKRPGTAEAPGSAASVRVDRSAPKTPNPGPDGSLYSERANALYGSQYKLDLDASDDHSGVKSIEVKVDGQRKGYVERDCPSSGCPPGRFNPAEDFEFNTDDYEDGDHTITLLARDQLAHQLPPGASQDRHTKKVEWQIEVDRAAKSDKAGELGHWQFEDEALTDRSGLRVNVGTGNLVGTASDLRLAGTGLNLEVERYYNALTAGRRGAVGRGWTLSVGQDFKVERRDGGNVRLYGPSGYSVLFTEPAEAGNDVKYKTPKGIKGDLRRESDGTFDLKIDGSRERYRFRSEDGAIGRHVDRNDREISYTYADGRLDTIRDTQDRTVKLFYNADGTVDRMVDQSSGSEGSSENRVYDYNYNDGLLTQYVDPLNGTYAYEYDAERRLKAVIDPKQVRSEIEYVSSSDYRVKKVVRAKATSLERSRSYEWNPTADTCENPALEDGDGDDIEADPTRSTDPRGNQTIYCADPDGRIRRVKDALGHRQETEFDAQSNVVNATSARTQSTKGIFDGRDLKQSQSPEGAVSKFSYQDHQPASAENAQGNTLSYGYDSSGNLESVKAKGPSTPEERQNELRYNKAGMDADERTGPNGTLRSSTTGKGVEAEEDSATWKQHTTVYRYNDDGELTEEDPPGQGPAEGGSGQGKRSFGYDDKSRVTSVTDGRRKTRTISYDRLDRVLGISYSDASRIKYTYDAAGNRIRRDEGTPDEDGNFDRTTSYPHDALNRVDQETFPGDKVVDYSYDKADNLLSLSDAGGTTSYSYDDDNLVQTVTEPCSGGTCDEGELAPVTRFDYNAAHSRTKTSFPNGVVQDVGVDNDERVTSIEAKQGSSTLTSLKYGYKTSAGAESGVRQSFEDDRRDEKTSYSYDFLGRLRTAEMKQTGASQDVLERYEYDFDKNSNRIESKSRNGRTVNFGYGESNELESAEVEGPAPNVSYQFDGAGNLTKVDPAGEPDTSYGYDDKGHNTRVELPGGQSLAMSYADTTQSERSTRGDTAFVNNRLGVGVQDNGSGQLLAFTRDNRGALLGQRKADSSQRHYYLTDDIGSVVAVTDSSGEVKTRYGYDPYGQTDSGRTDEDPAVKSPFRFQGQQADPATGLQKHGLRYYSNAQGRFTQNDPLVGFVDPRRSNRYVYGGGDPVNQVDPSGASFIGDVGEAALGTAAVAVGVGAAVIGTVGTTGCLATAFADGGLHAPACGVFAALTYSVAVGSAGVAYESFSRVGE